MVFYSPHRDSFGSLIKSLAAQSSFLIMKFQNTSSLTTYESQKLWATQGRLQLQQRSGQNNRVSEWVNKLPPMSTIIVSLYVFDRNIVKHFKFKKINIYIFNNLLHEMNTRKGTRRTRQYFEQIPKYPSMYSVLSWGPAGSSSDAIFLSVLPQKWAHMMSIWCHHTVTLPGE